MNRTAWFSRKRQKQMRLDLPFAENETLKEQMIKARTAKLLLNCSLDSSLTRNEVLQSGEVQASEDTEGNEKEQGDQKEEATDKSAPRTVHSHGDTPDTRKTEDAKQVGKWLFLWMKVRLSLVRFWGDVHGDTRKTSGDDAKKKKIKDRTRNAMQANGICCREWESLHWMQTTSKDLPSNLRACVQCALDLTIREKNNLYALKQVYARQTQEYKNAVNSCDRKGFIDRCYLPSLFLQTQTENRRTNTEETRAQKS